MEVERPAKVQKPRRKKSTKQAVTELQIEQRREKATELRVRGLPIRAIAKQLKTSVGTVHSDLMAVIERTKETADTYIERERALSLRRMDVAVRGLMPQVKKGSGSAVDALVKVEARRAKLDGLDAPDKVEHAGPDGGPIEVSAKSALEQKLHGLTKRLRPEPAQPGGATSP